MCDWTVLITTAPEELLSGKKPSFYRSRWQIELLFNAAKSQGLVADLSGSTEVRQLVRLWSRLIAALVQHWLVVGCGVEHPARSLSKACEAVRKFVGAIVVHLDDCDRLQNVLDQLHARRGQNLPTQQKRGNREPLTC